MSNMMKNSEDAIFYNGLSTVRQMFRQTDRQTRTILFCNIDLFL